MSYISGYPFCSISWQNNSIGWQRLLQCFRNLSTSRPRMSNYKNKKIYIYLPALPTLPHSLRQREILWNISNSFCLKQNIYLPHNARKLLLSLDTPAERNCLQRHWGRFFYLSCASRSESLGVCLWSTAVFVSPNSRQFIRANHPHLLQSRETGTLRQYSSNFLRQEINLWYSSFLTSVRICEVYVQKYPKTTDFFCTQRIGSLILGCT